MPAILSVSTFTPPYSLSQEVTCQFVKELFSESFQDLTRLLTVFQNGQIEKRNFAVPLEWFCHDHDLKERNDLYLELATDFGVEVISACLKNSSYLKKTINYEEIDAIFFVSSTGIATPSIDARIMNKLPFSQETKRIPLWGLGCAGGAAGLSRAYEFCLAYPAAKVLVVCIELCSLTFQKNDRSKSNLIGTSLFADGAACALVVGDEVRMNEYAKMQTIPIILQTGSYLMPDSLDVMGWDVRQNGLYVIFSRDIPNIIQNWLKPAVEKFLQKKHLELARIDEFILHPGGKKVLDAYESALQLDQTKTSKSRSVLKTNGNMSSPTVLYVLDECLKDEKESEIYGLMGALGPGFSAELLLLQWKEVSE